MRTNIILDLLLCLKAIIFAFRKIFGPITRRR
jgi:hypothetical protein